MANDVLTMGYVSMDRIIRIDSPARVGFTSIVTNPDCIEVNYGGCGVNVAVALCRLGLKAMPVLRVGRDWEQNGYRQFLLDAGVPLDATTVVPGEATSACFLLQDPQGNHITAFYPGSMDGKYARPIDEACFAGIRLGVVTVASYADNRRFFDACRRRAIPVAFGMRIDFDAFPRDFMWELLTGSRLVFMNEAEEQTVLQTFSLEHIEELFARGDGEIIVTTAGAAGSVCYVRTESGIARYRTGVCAIEKVVDATGGGDAFMSGFLYGLLSGRRIPDCCRLGTALAACVIQSVGCCTNIPSAERLQALAETVECIAAP